MRHLHTITPQIEMYNGSYHINIDLPHTWSDLTEDQLHYVLQLKASSTMSPIEIRTCAFLRFCDMEERQPRTDAEKEMRKNGHHFFRSPKGSKEKEIILPDWFMLNVVNSLSFLDHPTNDVVRLENIVKGYRPYSSTFNDLPFGEYLQIESLWQSAMAIQLSDDNSSDLEDIFEQMAKILYKPIVWWHCHVPGFDKHIQLPKRKPFSMDVVMQQNILFWMNGFHLFAQDQWPHLFRPGSGGGEVTRESLKEQIDVQIQALTGGDVTKMDAVLNVDTWSALNMLDIKQKDAELAKREAERREREIKSRKK